MSTIQFFKRSVFGRVENIPHGEAAPHVTTLTRRKTLTPTDLQALQDLGHATEEVPNPIPL